MKGDILINVLEVAAGAAVRASDLFLAFLKAGYGASYRKLEWEHAKIERRRAQGALARQVEQVARQRYAQFLYQLRRDGLLEENERAGVHLLRLTAKGKEKLAALRKRRSRMLPSVAYPRALGHEMTIVTFDVPERERRKRDWLRAVLKGLGFTMVHKSVWVGEVRIPRQLLEDLRDFRIAEFIEIFAVTKSGSLQQVR